MGDPGELPYPTYQYTSSLSYPPFSLPFPTPSLSFPSNISLPFPHIYPSQPFPTSLPAYLLSSPPTFLPSTLPSSVVEGNLTEVATTPILPAYIAYTRHTDIHNKLHKLYRPKIRKFSC